MTYSRRIESSVLQLNRATRCTWLPRVVSRHQASRHWASNRIGSTCAPRNIVDCGQSASSSRHTHAVYYSLGNCYTQTPGPVFRGRRCASCACVLARAERSSCCCCCCCCNKLDNKPPGQTRPSCSHRLHACLSSLHPSSHPSPCERGVLVPF